MWATRAASSAKRGSWNSCLSVFVWACSLLRLNRLSSRRQQMYTAPSSSRSSMTCFSIMLKKMLNRIGARTQPCCVPLTMGRIQINREVVNSRAKANSAFDRHYKRVWYSKHLSKDTKISVYPAVVLTPLLYDSESWVTYHLRLLKRFH